jgi:hypothetical protein
MPKTISFLKDEHGNLEETAKSLMSQKVIQDADEIEKYLM